MNPEKIKSKNALNSSENSKHNGNSIEVMMIEATVGNDYAIQLSNSLINTGAKVTLVVPEGREFFLQPQCSVKYWLPSKQSSVNKVLKMLKYFQSQFNILFYALRNRRAIIHYQFFRRRADAIFFLLLSILGIKVVKTAHNIFPHETEKFDRFFNTIVYKSASAIVVHTNYMKSKLLDNFKINKEKVKVIPHGNHDIYINEKNCDMSSARQELNLINQDKIILFFGVIREYKGLDLLLDAFDDAAETVTNLKLLIAGSPYTKSLRKSYEEKINNLKNKQSVIAHLKFIDSEDVAKYFRACDIVALPYKSIDHSGIFHLSFSFGKPVIATRVGDFVEVIEHNKSGYLLEENNTGNLEKWIKIAFSDMGKIREMGEYASHINKTKYSWDNIAQMTYKLYHKTLWRRKK